MRAATPWPTASAPTYPGGSPLDASEVERLVIRYTNEARARAGVPALAANPLVTRVARGHSQDMAEREALSHTLNGRDSYDRAVRAGFCPSFSDRFYSENIAHHPRVLRWSSSSGPTVYDRDDAAMARGLVDGWMGSPSHRENILDPDARLIGVGVSIRTGPEGFSGARFTLEEVWVAQNFALCVN